jgi:hypothetical protein
MWYVVAFLIGFFAGRLTRELALPFSRDLGALPLTAERRALFHDSSKH